MAEVVCCFSRGSSCGGPSQCWQVPLSRWYPTHTYYATYILVLRSCTEMLVDRCFPRRWSSTSVSTFLLLHFNFYTYGEKFPREFSRFKIVFCSSTRSQNPEAPLCDALVVCRGISDESSRVADCQLPTTDIGKRYFNISSTVGSASIEKIVIKLFSHLFLWWFWLRHPSQLWYGGWRVSRSLVLSASTYTQETNREIASGFVIYLLFWKGDWICYGKGLNHCQGKTSVFPCHPMKR